MQQRLSSDLSEHRARGGSTGSGGYAYFMSQVKMRLKREKSNRNNCNNNQSAASVSSSPNHFVPRRPYSCDVETLAEPDKFHHPDFYHHQATITRQTNRTRLASLGSSRTNCSHLQLAIVMDNEDTEQTSPMHPRKPPMAHEEDFALESSISCSPEDKSGRSDHTDQSITRNRIDPRQSTRPNFDVSRVDLSSQMFVKTPLIGVRPFPEEDCSNRTGCTLLCQQREKRITNEGQAKAAEATSLIDRLQGRFNASGSTKEASASCTTGAASSPSTAASLQEGPASRQAKRQHVVVSVTSFDGSTAITTFPSPRHPADRHQYQRSSSTKSPAPQRQARSPRGSLRRGKAVDLSSLENTLPFSAVLASSSPVKENPKSCPASATNTVVRPKRQSILRKLIGGSGSRNNSSEDASSCPSPPTTTPTALMTSSLGQPAPGGRSVSSAGLTVSSVAPDSTSYSGRSDFSSDSSDFKYEERVRRRIFAHYDCASICADTRPLLNGTSRLKDSNLNSTTGASQASKPFLISTSNAGQNFDAGPLSPDETGGSNEQTTNGKCNDIIVSCPYFINEIGAEPIRYISLCRDTYGQTQQRSAAFTCNCPACMYPYDHDGATLTVPACLNYKSRAIDDSSQTWHQTATAAEASVLENLSNVYLGGRLCARRQPQLVIEHVDQGAFYYRHCFSGRAHQNYFGIDDNLGPVAISVMREKIEFFDPRRYSLTSPFLYRLIIRLSDLSTFRGAILEESLPSYLSAKETREQQVLSSQQLHSSGQMTPGGSSSGLTGMAAAVGGGIVVGAIASGGSSRGKIPLKELLELVVPELQPSCLRLAVPVPRTEELLLKLDEQAIYTRYKVGILYCRAQQATEEQMYNNEAAAPAFDEFLDMMGQRVRLKGFDKYKGGLDCKGDTTGAYSLYTSYEQYEVMFHVSTMLPFTPQNKQQLSRKRHIGNDIVTVIFQEPGALPFSPQTVRSHFQHVFIVVRAHNPNTDNVRYSVAVSRCKDVPRFGPPLPTGATFPKSKDFRDFLLTKIINAENAVHKSEKFATMAARTRREFMRDLAENHATSHTLDGGASGKIASILLGSAAKRKDRPKPKLYLEAFVRGAIVWEVQVLTQVEDFSLCRPVECYLGISADNLVLTEQTTKEVLFCTPTHSIIGWSSHGNSLKLYYDHADVIILRTLDDEDSCEMQEIKRRLQAVTKGCETVEMILRRGAHGQLGFHMQHEGIVTEVEMYGFAWQSGLRQGSRIVEICKVSVATLTYERMLELLQTSVNVRVLVVPPLLEDGSPRRGCEDPYCPAVFSDEWPIGSTATVSSSPTYFDVYTSASGRHRQSLNLPQDRKGSMHTGAGNQPLSRSGGESVARRPLPPFGINQQQSLLRLQTGSTGSAGSQYSNSAGYFPSKSLDDIQHKRDRRHSEDIRCTSADHSTLLGGTNYRYRPNTYRLGVNIPDGCCYGDERGPGANEAEAPGQRTDTLSSSGSTASSEVSSDMTGIDATLRRKPTRPSALKRRVDRANSDMLQRVVAVASILERTSTDPSSTGAAGTPPCAPSMPPRNYRNVKCHSVAHPGQLVPGSCSSSGLGSGSGRSSPLSMFTGHLAVPSSSQRASAGGTSVHQNLLRLIADLESAGEIEEAIIISSALQQLSEATSRQLNLTQSGHCHASSPKAAQENLQRSPEKIRGVEWSSLVDAAARAIEGLSHRSASASGNGSPELSGYRLRLQAALQRIKLLEEKVDRVQMELDGERESKRELEIEVLRLRDGNKRLDEECTHAKMELKKFTEWFFNAVENSTVGGALAASCIPSSMIPFADDIDRKNT